MCFCDPSIRTPWCGSPDCHAPAIIPRQKKDAETKKEELLRRLEEYMEHSVAVKRYSDVGFYGELASFIEETTQDKGR